MMVEEVITARDRYLLKRYGITEADYDRMLADHNGICGICGNPPKRQRLHVDHDHKTGRVRGLLCYRCNRALPTYVTIAWLESAISYIQKGEQNASITSAGDSDSPDPPGVSRLTG